VLPPGSENDHDKPCAILIVEDEPLVREVLEKMLLAEGFAVAAAMDGRSAREALAAGEFDVLVIDVGLPGSESGLALAAAAAEDAHGVVLITGHPEQYDAVARSGRRHLFKPFRVEALVEAIHELLDEAGASCSTRRRRSR
jgi:DNA-binding NtrC family response regulator